MKNRKTIIAILCVISLGFVMIPNNVKAHEKLAVPVVTEETQRVYVDSDMSDEELLKEMERIENEKVQAQAAKTRSSTGYTVKLEFYRNEYRKTGIKVCGNQPDGGTNFGDTGGAFGYQDGSAHGAVSMSFGLSGYMTSASVGVGTKQAAGVNGIYVNAPPNKAVKLYVNKTVRAVTYKRYKVYNINGVKEPYGYTTSWPSTYYLDFSVR
ncbi:hypothetical protein EDD63_15013 [Breznakia blatticola]|uniref:Uncharacterized protein n=1 Tax=Breznakia blatticola TaxID=1754012 RepID=A0A4V3G640_9FIRM|nr:hypothetical protein [Breznakia blatticola]TDW13107.1 hypothetical protein EDD63_15013 [Breznakia blatticola]